MSDSDLDLLIAAWLDGRISQSDSEWLQQQLRESADARATFREFTKLDAAIREVASGDIESAGIPSVLPNQLAVAPSALTPDGWRLNTRIWAQLACAAAVLIMVGGIAYQLGKGDTPQPPAKVASGEYVSDPDNEQAIAGYATLRRVAGIQWSDGTDPYREGDVLPAGVLQFDQGVAEIDFFCGATVVVEGPAKMEFESDWSVRLLAGRLRASVPPAARGFVVKAADSEIIDLGTEFALEVGPDNVRVEVVDGEVKLRGGEYDGEHLVTGQGQSLMGEDAGKNSLQGLSTIGDVRLRHETERRQRFIEWNAYSQRLRTDERLIAYYPIAESKTEPFVANMAATGRELDGTHVGLVRHAPGRFGPESAGLEFGRLGARIRTRIDGEFQAFTFMCWVKIDSLENTYNALFMADGYENGEPHWQIRRDGRLMFSVMVDDTRDVRVPSIHDQQIVKDAGLHRVYFTEPFWDISKSGQWCHLVAVYDPIGRRVVQYVNGKQFSSEEIIDSFQITELRIGPAEIGNWGQPFRKTAWFAVRNLNGTIDELAIFKAALNAEEIENLYEQGKPLGY